MSLAKHAISWTQSRLHRVGVHAVRYPPPNPLLALVPLLSRAGVEVVLDIGANRGMYGRMLRDAGYEGRIVSFEPVSGAFRELADASSGDPLWDAHQFAIGRSDGRATIHVAGNAAASSSILPMLDRHRLGAPSVDFVASEEVEVRSLNPFLLRGKGAAFLKIDTQGYEMEVLKGVEDFKAVVGVQVELSLVPLYEGAPTYRQLMDMLHGLGYQIEWAEAAFTDIATGELLQFDAAFFRSDSPILSPSELRPQRRRDSD